MGKREFLEIFSNIKNSPNKEFISAIIEATPDIIYVFDVAEEKFVYTNKKITDTLFYSQDELLNFGKNVFNELIHPDDREKIFNEIKKYPFLKDKEVVEEEYRFRNKNGEYLFFQTRTTVFKRDINGEPKQVLGLAKDITNQKQIELLQQEQYVNIKFLSDSALQLNKFSEYKDVLDYIGFTLKKLMKDSIIIIFKTSGEDDFLFFHHIIGLDDSNFLNTSKNSNLNLKERKLKISDKFKEINKKGKLFHFKENITELIDGDFLSGLNEKIKETLGVFNSYTIGLTGYNKILGNIFIFKPDHITNKNLIGAFIYQTSIALERCLIHNHVKESEVLLNNIIESIPNPVFFKDKNGIHRKCNKDFADCLGMPIEKIIGSTILEFVNKDRADIHAKMDNELLENAGKRVYEVTMKFADQSLHEVQFYKSTVCSSNGNILGIVGIMVDITERKLMEEALEASNKRYRLLFESAGEAIYLYNTDGKLIDVNQTACKRLGYSRYELLNMNIKEIFTPEYRPIFAERLQKLEQNIHCFFRSENVTKEGRIFPTEDSMSIFEYNGKRTILNISRDITTQANTQKQIEASLKEKEVLLKEIHHRVKNNFQIITSLLSLQEKIVHDKNLIAPFNDAKNRIRSMALIHEKLYQSKDFSRINLVDYINAISQELYHTYYYDSKKVELKFNLKKVLVELERAIPCGLIINEILTNSFKYAFPKEFDKPAEIRIFLHQKKDKIILNISDNGIGIPQHINIENTKTLGLQLISILTDQIRGKYDLNRTSGTEWNFEF